MAGEAEAEGEGCREAGRPGKEATVATACPPRVPTIRCLLCLAAIPIPRAATSFIYFQFELYLSDLVQSG